MREGIESPGAGQEPRFKPSYEEWKKRLEDQELLQILERLDQERPDVGVGDRIEMATNELGRKRNQGADKKKNIPSDRDYDPTNPLD